MMKDAFQNKNVLVTGAGRGIGRHAAETLAEFGAKVYALSKNPDNINSLLQQYPKSVISVPCDLRDWDVTEKTIQALPAMHYVVNNAGVAYRESFFNISPQVFDEIYAVNLKALMNVTKNAAQKMVDAGIKGSIVNVSSVTAKKRMEGIMTYGTSKAAVDMFTKCAAVELAPHGIRVNSVNPTVVRATDMAKSLFFDGIEEEERSKIPLGKFAECAHCTNAILYLLSDLSAMTTGEFLLIDGGVAAN